MKNYVLNHDFGYGKKCHEINKLNLRNIEDVKIYVKSVIGATFVGAFDEDVLVINNQCKIKISIEGL